MNKRLITAAGLLFLATSLHAQDPKSWPGQIDRERIDDLIRNALTLRWQSPQLQIMRIGPDRKCPEDGNESKPLMCAIRIEVQSIDAGAACSALVTVGRLLVSKGVKPMILWEIAVTDSKLDSGDYKFDDNYAVEVVQDEKNQMSEFLRLSDTQFIWVNKNDDAGSVVDYLPHVLRRAADGVRFIPCKVKDPKIVNDGP